jgi:protein-tyrosine phosphatase
MAAPATDADVFGIDEAKMQAKLQMLRGLVAQPVPAEDPEPCVVGDGLLVGNKYHVAQPDLLSRLGVTAVLNCASSGVRNLPLDEYEERGIAYHFTNCARDDETYPILHTRDGVMSAHLKKAQEVYVTARASGGKALFNCAAGQNRSATLAVAVQVLGGVSLQRVLEACATARPFVVENVGFQRQLIELEAMHGKRSLRSSRDDDAGEGAAGFTGPFPRQRPFSSAVIIEEEMVLVELRVPGLGNYNVRVPAVSTVPALKQRLVSHVNERHAAAWRGRVGSGVPTAAHAPG